jgi:Ase1/PRC1/MAP65 family protein
VYSDALLSAHEVEISRLEALKDQRAPILSMIDKHRSLIKDRNDLQQSSQDASRLMARGNKGEKRDPGKLLREEKMRKKIAKELPRIEAELRTILENFEEEYGRAFMVHGERYLDELNATAVATTTTAKSSTRSRTPAPSATPAPVLKTVKSNPTSRAGTIRGPPPVRAKTPVNTHDSVIAINRHVLNSCVSTNASARAHNKSPSRIPARAPLKGMPYGGNSPERKLDHGEATVRKMGPPRGPPPKMKDIFIAPQTTSLNQYDFDDRRMANVVRSVPPEDVYDDRPQAEHSYLHSSMVRSNDTYSSSGYALSLHHAPRPPSVRLESRQVSTSSISTAAHTNASGSENWETYDDNSEPEQDASDAYYAKVRATQMRNAAKRYTPDDGCPTTSGIGKKPRLVNGESLMMAEGIEGQYRIAQSTSSWEDEDN